MRFIGLRQPFDWITYLVILAGVGVLFYFLFDWSLLAVALWYLLCAGTNYIFQLWLFNRKGKEEK